MIDRYQLRYFLAVVEAGNFSKAAARMNVTQPTLSVGIAKLEAQLGTKLFHRTNQRVHLTEAGSRLLAHARAIENEFNRAVQSITGLKPARLVRVGVLATIPTAIIEQIVVRQRSLDRQEHIEIVEGNERDIASLLDRGRIDIALTVLRSGAERFVSEPLYSEGYALAMPVWHRFAHLESVPGEDLADDVMIVRRQCEALPETSRYFTERGVRPEFSLRTMNDDRALALVRAGLGITVMPETYRDRAIRQPKLAGFDLQRDIGIQYAVPDAQASAVVEAIRAVAAEWR